MERVADEADLPDEYDQATSEYLQYFTLRLRGREKYFLDKIEQAIARVKDGSFGYCDACGVQIGMNRLRARPETTLCIRCKEAQEREERQRRAQFDIGDVLGHVRIARDHVQSAVLLGIRMWFVAGVDDRPGPGSGAGDALPDVLRTLADGEHRAAGGLQHLAGAAHDLPVSIRAGQHLIPSRTQK